MWIINKPMSVAVIQRACCVADVIRDKITTKMDKIELDFAGAIVRISMLRGSFSSI